MNGPFVEAEAQFAISWPDWIFLVVRLRGISDNTAFTAVQAAELQLKEVCDFLAGQPAFRGQFSRDLDPLHQLYAALVSLDRGFVAPLLTPPKRKRGGPKNYDVWLEPFKGVAAQAMSQLILAGEKPAEAAKRVAQACGNIRGYTNVTSRMVNLWRNQFHRSDHKGAPKDGPGYLTYRSCLTIAPDKTPKERAEVLLQQLTKPRKASDQFSPETPFSS